TSKPAATRGTASCAWPPPTSSRRARGQGASRSSVVRRCTSRKKAPTRPAKRRAYASEALSTSGVSRRPPAGSLTPWPSRPPLAPHDALVAPPPGQQPIQAGEAPQQGMEPPEEPELPAPAGEVGARDHRALGRPRGRGPAAQRVRRGQREVDDLGTGAGIGAAGLEDEARAEHLAERRQRVPRPDVAVLLVGEADRVPHAVEQGTGLEVRDVDDQRPPGRR